MAGLVEFLLARIAEDKAVANERDQYPSYPWGMSEAELQFMARFHPDRILAECAAKRAIVELHEPPCDECLSGEYVTIDGVDVPRQHGMDPCRTLRLLALPFADHSDFDPDWAAAT